MLLLYVFADDDVKRDSTARPSTLVLDGPVKSTATVKRQSEQRSNMDTPQRDTDHIPVQDSSSEMPTVNKEGSPVTNGNSSFNAKAMSFTIDLGDEADEAKKVSMNESLSKFLPHKVRRSFRERQTKSMPKDTVLGDIPQSEVINNITSIYPLIS